jgi:hypothetical protein
VSYSTRTEVLHQRAARLAEIADLPDCAYITPLDAAALLDTSPGVMANWRSKKRGPRFVRSGDFIRYQLGALKAFAEGRDRLEWAAPSGRRR